VSDAALPFPLRSSENSSERLVHFGTSSSSYAGGLFEYAI
jgi:hypothetical protein